MRYLSKLFISIFYALAVALMPSYASTSASKDQSGINAAINECNLVEIKRLITDGVDVNTKVEIKIPTGEKIKISLLPAAIASCESHEINEMLIQAGANINAKDRYKMTPLYLATLKKQNETAIALIEAGADVNAKNIAGDSPLNSAVYNGKIEVVIALIEAGADVNAKNNESSTALHYSAVTGQTEIAIALIQAGADVNAETKDKLTPLHAAAISGNPQTAIALIEAGADIHATDNRGHTPLDYAKKQGKSSVVEILENPPLVKER